MEYSEAMAQGNLAFLTQRYARAYELYENASNSAPNERELLNAHSNLSILQEELEMKEASEFSSPGKNKSGNVWPLKSQFPDCPKRQEPILQPIFGDEVQKETHTIPYSPGIDNLIDATTFIEKNKNRSFSYAERGEIFTSLNHRKNATADFLKAFQIEPSNQFYLSMLINSSLRSNDLGIYTESIKYLDDSDCFGSLAQALLLWSSRRFDEALLYLNAAVKAQEEDALWLRAKLNFVLGNISAAYADWQAAGTLTEDVTFILRFLKEQHIPPEPSGTTWQCVAMRHFRAGVFRSLSAPRSALIPLSFYVPPAVQEQWASGGRFRASAAQQAPSDLTYPEGFALGLSESQFAASVKLLRVAQAIGSATSPRECSKRADRCVGMAVIEIVQELWDDQNALKKSIELNEPEKNTQADIVPNDRLGLEMAASVAANWLRLLDPLQPIFSRYNIPSSLVLLHVQRDLFLTDLVIFQPRLLALAKERLREGMCPTAAERLMAAQTADDIWSVVRSDFSVPCGCSDAEIFAKRMPQGHIEFGLLVPNTRRHWSESLGRLYAKWAQLMNQMSSGASQRVLLGSALEVLYLWMCACPLTALNHTIGQIIFHALVIRILGRVAFDLPPPVNILVEALLSSGFEEFAGQMGAHMKANLLDLKIEELPSVAKNLPNFPARIQALLNPKLGD